MKFNEQNELMFIVEGSVLQELQINDDIKEKINYLINKSDTSNFLIRLNGAFDIEESIQKSFNDTVISQHDKEKS